MKKTFFKITSVVLLITFFLQGVITEAEENGLGITDFAVVDDRINPQINQLTVYFYLSKDSAITLRVLKGSENIATLASEKRLAKGPHIITWDAKHKGKFLDEGKYTIRINEENFQKNIPIQIAYSSPPAMTVLNVWPRSFTPGGVTPRKSQGIFFNASESGHITITIEQSGKIKKRLIDRDLPSGSVRQAWWDGRDDRGDILGPGTYDVVAKVSNKKGSDKKVAKSIITIKDELPANIVDLRNKINNLYSSKEIDNKTYKRYRSTVDKASDLLNDLKSQGKDQEYLDLSYVVRQSAHSDGVFEKAHGLILDINLAVNVGYFAKNKTPEPWSVFDNLDDSFTFIYYRDRGLQPHPVISLVRLSKIKDNVEFLRSINKILGHYATYKHNEIEFKTIPYQFEFMGGPSFWPSAMSQGMILPSIAKAYRLTGKKHYLDSAEQIMNSFTVDHKYGGVLDKGVSGKEQWYLEYAFSSSLKVFNGKVIALQGLKSYANLTGNKQADQLFRKGLSQINKSLHMYDYKSTEGGSWSKYCNIQYPASDHYHLLNTILLEWAAQNKEQISRGAILEYYAKKWRQPISSLAKLEPGRFDEAKILEGMVKTYDYEITDLNDQSLL